MSVLLNLTKTTECNIICLSAYQYKDVYRLRAPILAQLIFTSLQAKKRMNPFKVTTKTDSVTLF